MALDQAALEALHATSRTFFIPISRLPDGLQDAIGSAYLCLRAIDEIEDHPALANADKAALMRKISSILQGQRGSDGFGFQPLADAFSPHRTDLAPVTLGLARWLGAAPPLIAPRIWDATAAMAERMADWAAAGWVISDEADLDRYTYAVAGAVGILLCDLWAFYRGEQYDRARAVEFGRGLQSVNILRNHTEDLTRGVDLFPRGWKEMDMHRYARRQLDCAAAYAKTLPEGPFKYFMSIPQVLAYATLDSLARGETKLSRLKVLEIMQQFADIPSM